MSILERPRIRLKQATYFGLSLLFGFDRWHYHIVRENCVYFKKVKELHEAIGPRTTIEIGCGLGEIISGLNAEMRIGVDRDIHVIRAARVIRPGSIRFLTDTELPGSGLLRRDNGVVCLIFLNWFHVYAVEDLKRIVGEYIKQSSASYIMFDIINDAAKGYRYKHQANLLGDIGAVISVQDAGDAIRHLVVMDVRK